MYRDKVLITARLVLWSEEHKYVSIDCLYLNGISSDQLTGLAQSLHKKLEQD